MPHWCSLCLCLRKKKPSKVPHSIVKPSCDLDNASYFPQQAWRKKWFSFAEHFNTHNIFFSHILEFAWFSHDPTVWVAFLTIEGVSEEKQLAHGYSSWAFIFHYISVCICVGVGVCGCRETQGIKSSRCVVTGNCDLPDLGAGIQIWGFARTVHPYPLSHLSSPTGFC